MYWKIKTITEDEKTSITYEYFALVDRPTSSKPFYSAAEKRIIHPSRYELTVLSHTCESEEEFKNWYQINKKL